MTTDPREQRANAWAEMQDLMAQTRGRSLNEAEQARFDQLERDIRSATSQLTFGELGDGFSAVRDQPTSVVEGGAYRSGDDSVRILKAEERMASVVPAGAPAGFTMRDYMRGIVTGEWGDIPHEARAMSVGTDGAGGFLVPEPLSARVIDKARNQARIFQAGALTVPMASSTMKLARVAGDPTAAWKLENAAATVSDMTLEQVELTARTLIGYVKSSVELIEDSAPGVDDIIENALASALALELDRAALRGSGTPPEPQGVRNATGVTLQSQGTNGAALTSYDALSTAVQTVQANNFEPNAVIYSPRTAGTLDRLKDTTNQPLRPPPSFEELRKFVTKQIPEDLTHGTATNASEAYVAQWNQLLIGMRQRLRIEASREAADATDSAFRQLQVHIRAYLRADVAVAQPPAFVVVTGIIP
ncbi:MAG TPA: phage major capsid protein [Candidatus Limnocylindria bacterium]|nr:phage major capsid protein [Candidatus Limnocylindria bacterium]